MMTPKHLAAGDILQDPVGRTVVLVRNEDTGELFTVYIGGFDSHDIRIEKISDLGDGFIVQNFTPIATAYQRENPA